MEEYLLDTLSNIESSHPNCGILLTGDFNRLDVRQVTNHFRFKQLVDFATGGDNTLDLILTNWNEYYLKPVKLPPFGLSTVNRNRMVRLAGPRDKYVIVHFYFWSRDDERGCHVRESYFT